MLYDPKWETQTGLAGFIAWLERQDPQQMYDWPTPQKCALGLFAKSIGRTPGDSIQDAVWAVDIQYSIAIHRAVMEIPWTFGAALERVRAVGGI
jgi:hypothetical protein